MFLASTLTQCELKYAFLLYSLQPADPKDLHKLLPPQSHLSMVTQAVPAMPSEDLSLHGLHRLHGLHGSHFGKCELLRAGARSFGEAWAMKTKNM